MVCFALPRRSRRIPNGTENVRAFLGWPRCTNHVLRMESTAPIVPRLWSPIGVDAAGKEPTFRLTSRDGGDAGAR